jgi:hypothetical protein
MPRQIFLSQMPVEVRFQCQPRNAPITRRQRLLAARGELRLAPSQKLLFILVGIMLNIIKYLPDLPVDPDGKFCYGRGILKIVVTTLPGIAPRRPAGAALALDLFTSPRR